MAKNAYTRHSSLAVSHCLPDALPSAAGFLASMFYRTPSDELAFYAVGVGTLFVAASVLVAFLMIERRERASAVRTLEAGGWVHRIPGETGARRLSRGTIWRRGHF